MTNQPWAGAALRATGFATGWLCLGCGERYPYSHPGCPGCGAPLIRLTVGPAVESARVDR